MLLDGLTVEDTSGGGHGDTTPPPKSKIPKRKLEEQKEDEKKEEGEKKETSEAEKRIRRGGEGREGGKGARWRMRRHIQNVSVTITSLI